MTSNSLINHYATKKRANAADAKLVMIDLISANHELAVQNSEKEEAAAELVAAYQKLAVQSSEKKERAEALAIAYRKLAVQSSEKAARSDELVIENHELAFQNSEKEAHSTELFRANVELFFQNCEKDKQAIAFMKVQEELFILNEELRTTNEYLHLKNLETEQRTIELTQSYRENTALNEQVYQMQKLESIGQLITGITNDFNNILTSMLGFNEMNHDVIDDVTDERLKVELENHTQQIDIAGKRAATLISQILNNCRQRYNENWMV